MRARFSRAASTATACLVCSAFFAMPGCTDDRSAEGGPGEQAAADARPTNRSLFAEQITQGAEGFTPEDEAAAVSEFRRVWAKHQPVFRSRFLGVRTMQNPLDAWVVQEVIVEVVPDVIVEAGTAYGGSSLLWSMLLREVNPEGRVITIDIEDRREERARQHPLARGHVDFLHGSSTDPAIIAEVKSRVGGRRVLVLLDSLHTREHIAAELAAYAPLVAKGSYVIVQDTPLGGEEAIAEFIARDDRFVVDRSRERFVLTNSRSGYLKRVR
jgi:cephalosporin hydroxylase